MIRRLERAARAAWRELRTDRISDYVTIKIDEQPAPGRESFVPTLIDDAGVDVDVPSCGVPDYGARERGWMQTVTGRRFYPLEPNVDDIDIYDIAHGLGMCCRYAGHAKRFYSVAEHCVHVSREVERVMREANGTLWRVVDMPKPTEREILKWSLAALLHDSSEAYLGDMIRPLKHQPEMAEFRRAEARIEMMVCMRFSLTTTPAAWALIKSIDDRIIADEIALLKIDPSMYVDVAPAGGPLGVRLECWSPVNARDHFLLRFEGLAKALLVDTLDAWSDRAPRAPLE